MPFDEPFVNQYKEGDLFYGFQDPRSDLMRQLKIAVGQQSLNALWTINNYLATSTEYAQLPGRLSIDIEKSDEAELARLQATDSAWQSLKGRPFSEKKGVLDALKTKVADTRLQRESAMRKPHDAFRDTLVTYKGGKYKYALDHAPDSTEKDKDLENARQNSAWRKKCKGGIYHAIFVNKTNVHFCLAGSKPDSTSGKYGEMNYLDVVDKTDPFDKPATSTRQKFHVITPAELRWIYRNRNSQEVQQRVQFWKFSASGNQWAPCGPPWKDSEESARNAWAKYKPKSENVHSKAD